MEAGCSQGTAWGQGDVVKAFLHTTRHSAAERAGWGSVGGDACPARPGHRPGPAILRYPSFPPAKARPSGGPAAHHHY